jgi:hypothetical protein
MLVVVLHELGAVNKPLTKVLGGQKLNIAATDPLLEANLSAHLFDKGLKREQALLGLMKQVQQVRSRNGDSSVFAAQIHVVKHVAVKSLKRLCVELGHTLCKLQAVHCLKIRLSLLRAATVAVKRIGVLTDLQLLAYPV